MKKSLFILLAVLLLTGCGSKDTSTETTPPATAPTEKETELVARDSPLQTKEVETEEETEPTIEVPEGPVYEDLSGEVIVGQEDYKGIYKAIKNSHYARYKDAIIVDLVVPSNDLNSDFGEQIPIWDFDYQEFNFPGMNSVYEQVDDLFMTEIKDGINTVLSLVPLKQEDPIEVIYAAIDNEPGKGWEKGLCFLLGDKNDERTGRYMLMLLMSKENRAVRVASFPLSGFEQSFMSVSNSYKGPTITLNPETNEIFDVVGAMPLEESSFLNKIGE